MTAIDQAADLDDLPDHLQEIAAGRVPEHVAAVLAAAPPLTGEQVERVRALLRPLRPHEMART